MALLTSLTSDITTLHQVVAVAMGLVGIAWVASAVRLALRSK